MEATVRHLRESDENKQQARKAWASLEGLLERSLVTDFSGKVGVELGIKRGTILYVTEQSSRNR